MDARCNSDGAMHLALASALNSVEIAGRCTSLRLRLAVDVEQPVSSVLTRSGTHMTVRRFRSRIDCPTGRLSPWVAVRSGQMPLPRAEANVPRTGCYSHVLPRSLPSIDRSERALRVTYVLRRSSMNDRAAAVSRAPAPGKCSLVDDACTDDLFSDRELEFTPRLVHGIGDAGGGPGRASSRQGRCRVVRALRPLATVRVRHEDAGSCARAVQAAPRVSRPQRKKQKPRSVLTRSAPLFAAALLGPTWDSRR